MRIDKLQLWCCSSRNIGTAVTSLAAVRCFKHEGISTNYDWD